MRKKVFHIAIWMLLISSSFFFMLSFFEYREHQKTEQQFEQLQERLRDVIPFQFDAVLAALDLSTPSNNLDVKRNEETPSRDDKGNYYYSDNHEIPAVYQMSFQPSQGL